jgi:hypothetical protein
MDGTLSLPVTGSLARAGWPPSVRLGSSRPVRQCGDLVVLFSRLGSMGHPDSTGNRELAHEREKFTKFKGL